MSFLTLLATIGVAVLIASLITNMLKGILLAISGFGIVFYLFFATIEQKVALDTFANNFKLPSSLDFQNINYIQSLQNLINGGTQIIENTAKEVATELKK